MSPSTIHEMWVTRLVKAGAKTRGWRRALRELEIENPTSIPDRRPDAFFVFEDEDTPRVVAYEVEITRPLTEDRLLEYADLWAMLDCDSIELELKVVDRFGSETDVPLMSIWYAAMDERVRSAA